MILLSRVIFLFSTIYVRQDLFTTPERLLVNLKKFQVKSRLTLLSGILHDYL